MQELEFNDVTRVTERLDKVKARFPEERKAVAQAVGKAMLAAVQTQIGGSGKVRGWQDHFEGSGGGWAAVRAKPKTYWETKHGKRYAVGYITNAFENGHRTRPPSGKSKRYRRRLRKPYVPGKGAYHAAEAEVENVAFSAAEQAMDRLASEGEE